jgi:hypothetical protein
LSILVIGILGLKETSAWREGDPDSAPGVVAAQAVVDGSAVAIAAPSHTSSLLTGARARAASAEFRNERSTRVRDAVFARPCGCHVGRTPRVTLPPRNGAVHAVTAAERLRAPPRLPCRAHSWCLPDSLPVASLSSAAAGVIHGCSGSGHLLGVLPALAMPSLRTATAYLCMFGLGAYAQLVR